MDIVQDFRARSDLPSDLAQPRLCGSSASILITNYGSDRCFAESVTAIRNAFPDADIEVVLPRPGAIVSSLEGTASRIVFEKLWVCGAANYYT